HSPTADPMRPAVEHGTLVLCDVTSTYFEGRTCELARFGYNRDGKAGELQIVFGLLCTAEGCPVAVEVFEGNVGDPSTRWLWSAEVQATKGFVRRAHRPYARGRQLGFCPSGPIAPAIQGPSTERSEFRKCWEY